MSGDPTGLEFCPELRPLLVDRFTVGRSGKRYDNLSSVSTLNNILTIRNLMLRLKPDSTLEVGLAFGASALAFAASHRDNGAQPAAQHTAIDPFQPTVWDEAALVNLEQADLRGFVDYRPSHSWDALSQLLREKAQFDLAYIDGSHLFEDVFVDYYLIARLLKPGGIMLFDDCPDPHVAKVIRFVESNMSDQFEEMDLGEYRAGGGRTLRYRIGKALGKLQLRAFRQKAEPNRRWDVPFSRF
jgi:predicted O-methyltransferase YrrM